MIIHDVHRSPLIALLVLLVAGSGAAAGDITPIVADLGHKWAAANYQTSKDRQESAFKTLVDEAARAVVANPDQAPLLAWQGIILSSYAGAKGGFGAISVAEQALKSLEAAATIDEQALAGGIDTSIGALYYKVPGWPLGFGNDNKAEAYLLKGLAINPAGIDENYFFADFLIEQGEKKKAKTYLEKALNAPPRPGREDADLGRRQEIQAVLDQLNS